MKFSAKYYVIGSLILLFILVVLVRFFLAPSYRLVYESRREHPYVLQSQYPQFEKASDEFNRKIIDWVREQERDFKDGAINNWIVFKETTLPEEVKKHEKTPPYALHIKTEVALSNAEFISVVMRSHSYLGGANGITTMQTFNYDIKNKSEMTLYPFFRQINNYLVKLTAVTRAQLKNQLEAQNCYVEQMFLDGTLPDPYYFRNFSFNSYQLRIHFPRYQVAPGACGEEQVTLGLTSHQNGLQVILPK